MEGWIKLHRKIMDSPVFDNPKLLKTWIWCMCNAAHTTHEVIIGRKNIILNPGEFIFGRKKAARELGISEGTVYDYMHLLETRGSVSLKPNNKYTLVKVENWELYQISIIGDQHQNEQPKIQPSIQPLSTQKTEKRHNRECKDEKESNKGNKEKNNIIYPPKGGMSDKTSDIPSFPLEDALLTVKEVSKKRDFSTELQEAFTRWIKHKYSIGDGFKNAHAVDKVGASIESHTFVMVYRMEDRSQDVIKLIDYCIATRSKSLCWSRIGKF